jgi:hypothetical protein
MNLLVVHYYNLVKTIYLEKKHFFGAQIGKKWKQIRHLFSLTLL